MTDQASPTPRPIANDGGRIERALVGLFTRTAEVVEVETLSEHFRADSSPAL